MAVIGVADFGDHSEMVEVAGQGPALQLRRLLVGSCDFCDMMSLAFLLCSHETLFSEGTPEEMHS